MITRKEYHTRRKTLAARIPAGAIALIPAAGECIRNADTHYRFRQDSDFFYLTGFDEPDALLVITAGASTQSLLFSRARNPSEEKWTGPRLGQEGAVSELGMDEAWPMEQLQAQLPELLAGRTAVCFPFGRSPWLEKAIHSAMQSVKMRIRRGTGAPDILQDLDPVLGEMRLFKSEAECALMMRAADISVRAHQRAMAACRHLDNECQLEAELVYTFLREGCRANAYDPIVGNGANACVLHYTANNAPLVPGNLVLIDAGGEYAGYAADITRTWPVNGRFTPEQRAVYDLVLAAQKAGVEAVRPGAPWDSIQRIIVDILTRGLCELGILRGNPDALIRDEAYRPYYMHNSGHWLGLDVHDCGRYRVDGAWRPLEPGMVLTVEPGLYLSADIPGLDARWWNIGVRIEDDILVTENGHKNLTAALAVDADSLEALIRD
ncbi:proline aminopeptidase P II [Legionella geestiana]|uniref:Xaa-Pro aminopeptidase n=1 Tax=Legionella geestiana TaxID=45065 RepID=A0A0W0TNS3_9GAMM|nr:Xaa-Pro aminopeptidase [Legionella geestiana]KTC97247.1 proline aminopeptidase P II [Legionella geestiana]QBS12379.1 Xaa-Pro aminopeptidase [Legionella geestiana]QDQ39908.1 Xaa-Pro aminopeptidase [Legionella geestiana]STX55182.1 proline aminopeptidase P II [Legionella geestiana]